MRKLLLSTLRGIISFLLFSLFSLSLAYSANQTEENSKNAVNWEGVYIGTLPLNGTEIIKVKISLKADQSYLLEYVMQGKEKEPPTQVKGKLSWSKDGSEMILSNTKNTPSRFKIGNNTFIPLDKSGVALADNWRAYKVLFGITEIYWKLTELYGTRMEQAQDSPREPFLLLKGANHQMHSSGGCNIINGNYEISADIIQITPTMSSMMACPGLETETHFTTLLHQAQRFAYSDDTLVLFDKDGTSIAKFKASFFY